MSTSSLYQRRSLISFSEDSMGKKPRRTRTGTPPPPTSATRNQTLTLLSPRKAAADSTPTPFYKNPLLRPGLPRNPETSHQNYIDSMLYRIGLEKELDFTTDFDVPDDVDLPFLSEKGSALSIEVLEMPKPAVISRGDESKSSRVNRKVRRIEIPWRTHDPFTSPADIQKKAFDSFRMMCPELPKTPPKEKERGPETPAIVLPAKVVKKSGGVHPAPKAKGKLKPGARGPRKPTEQAALDKSRGRHIPPELEKFIRSKSPSRFQASGLSVVEPSFGPKPATAKGTGAGPIGQSRIKLNTGLYKTGIRVVHESEFFRPVSKPLPPATLPRSGNNSAVQAWMNGAPSKNFKHVPDNIKVQLSVIGMNPAKAEPRSTFARLEHQRRRELAALAKFTSPTTRVKYGSTRDPPIRPGDVKPKMMVKPKVEEKSKVHLPNPAVSKSKSTARTPVVDPAQPPKHQKLQGELHNMQRLQFQRRMHPAMMFPYHVPGPKQDNIYIGTYEGSDSEEDENEENKTSDTKLT